MWVMSIFCHLKHFELYIFAKKPLHTTFVIPSGGLGDKCKHEQLGRLCELHESHDALMCECLHNKVLKAEALELVVICGFGLEPRELVVIYVQCSRAR